MWITLSEWAQPSSFIHFLPLLLRFFPAWHLYVVWSHLFPHTSHFSYLTGVFPTQPEYPSTNVYYYKLCNGRGKAWGWEVKEIWRGKNCQKCCFFSLQFLSNFLPVWILFIVLWGGWCGFGGATDFLLLTASDIFIVCDNCRTFGAGGQLVECGVQGEIDHIINRKCKKQSLFFKDK